MNNYDIIKNQQIKTKIKHFKLQSFLNFNFKYFNELQGDYYINSNRYNIDIISLKSVDKKYTIIFYFEFDKITDLVINSSVTKSSKISENFVYNFMYKYYRKFPYFKNKINLSTDYFMGNIKLFYFLNIFIFPLFSSYVEENKLELLNYGYYENNHNWKYFKKFISIYYSLY